jgi:hypothetical protein
MLDLLPLVLKASLAASVVVAATMAAERSGPFWGALITSLPVSIGPIYVVMAMDASADFISQGLLSSLATNDATILFLLAAALAATRTRPAGTVALAILAWGAATALIHQITWPPLYASLLNIAVLIATLAILRVWVRTGTAAPAPRRWFDLPLRALLVGSLTVFVALTSEALGPKYSGILAITPIVFISTTIVLLKRLGGPATAATLSRAVLPIGGFGLGLLVAHLATARFGSVTGLSAGLATALCYSGCLAMWYLRSTRYRKPGPGNAATGGSGGGGAQAPGNR